MIGLDCERAEIVVVDCDLKNGLRGFDHFQRMCHELGIDLRTVPRVLTPRGGEHYFFADPTGELRCSASTLAPNVDVRGAGGYVIAPGSQRADGKTYELIGRNHAA